LLAAVCLSAGLAGGIGVQLGASPPDGPAVEESSLALPDHESLATREPVFVAPAIDEPRTDVERIDWALRSGDFAAALKHCRAVPQTEGTDRRALAYREALCLEGLDQWAEAGTAYKRAGGADGPGDAWVLLGQARCATATGDLDAARGFLDQAEQRPGGTGSECLYLRAHLTLLERRPSSPDPLDVTALSWPAPAGLLDAAIRRLASADEDETPPDPDLAPAPESAAAACWQRALAADPNHPAARAVRVWLANLDAEDRRWHRAATEYRRLLDAAPHAAESVSAAYNLGLVELGRGEFEAAGARFVEVADRRPKTRWADLGWWWAGRARLDSGDAAGAVKSLRTALAGSSADVSSAAVLGLCACHLLSGEDAEARQVLRGHRLALSDRHIAAGAMLEAILRYRLAPADGRRTILEAALRDAADGELLGPAGRFLAGQAYRDMGAHDRMAELYERTADGTRGPLAFRMTFAVAERMNELDRRAPARRRYLAVAAADPDGLGPRARLRLADLAARDGNGAECVALCRAALDRPGIDRSEALPILGRGYELLGRYRQAAEAFAGRVPAE
jgi:tetratricopeptide (TPR) repeat protein